MTMTTPPDPTAVEEKARAVEEAWEQGWGTSQCLHAISVWLTARRAARDAGIVSVMVSQESLEALREFDPYTEWGRLRAAPVCDLFLRDLKSHLEPR